MSKGLFATTLILAMNSPLVAVIAQTNIVPQRSNGSEVTVAKRIEQGDKVFDRGRWRSKREVVRERERRVPDKTGQGPVLATTDPAEPTREDNQTSAANGLLQRPGPATVNSNVRSPINTNTTSDTGAANGVAPSNPATPSNTTTSPNTAPREVAAVSSNSAPLTAIYRIGVGDVLDIRRLNSAARESSLYTVMAGGLLEYPLVGDPLVVAGLTTDEIDAKLTAELKRRAIDQNPQVVVSVREYASHTVVVSGLVAEPGTKLLRREAVPLYVVLAEAQLRPEAGRATVIARATGQSTTIDLSNSAAMNVLVQAGDVVTVTGRVPQFLYIGGRVDSPGQKDFHSGMTLTQAILASGGVTSADAVRVRISRQGPDGRLISSEFNLIQIMSGEVPDPPLQPGDRVEVGRARK